MAETPRRVIRKQSVKYYDQESREHERHLKTEATRFALIPKLIGRRIVLSDGYPREVMFDPKSGHFVARYAENQFYHLNAKLEPTSRADRHTVRRCGFTYPRPIHPEGRKP